MIHCAERNKLREENALLFAERVAVQDELKMTKKNDARYREQLDELQKIKGRLKEARKRYEQHIEGHKCV